MAACAVHSHPASFLLHLARFDSIWRFKLTLACIGEWRDIGSARAILYEDETAGGSFVADFEHVRRNDVQILNSLPRSRLGGQARRPLSISILEAASPVPLAFPACSSCHSPTVSDPRPNRLSTRCWRLSHRSRRSLVGYATATCRRARLLPPYLCTHRNVLIHRRHPIVLRRRFYLPLSSVPASPASPPRSSSTSLPLNLVLSVILAAHRPPVSQPSRSSFISPPTPSSLHLSARSLSHPPPPLPPPPAAAFSLLRFCFFGWHLTIHFRPISSPYCIRSVLSFT
ncbi:hypothetical protein MSAN_01606700 [Mycena sanguinolenta]|uniref:Uncharacterized protein n=1 Tax=Mycena sanguinolenta TaxID=230812 RepID=A0A8H6Y0F4_9AGAR|nr:hypothetical protein MSAN_01606700 [Mycena sanguinolenta]